MLAEAELNKGGKSEQKLYSSHDTSGILKLKDMGITYSQSSQWQAIAKIPDDVFENHITETRQAKKELVKVRPKLATLRKSINRNPVNRMIHTI